MPVDLAVATPTFLDLTFIGLESLPKLGEECFAGDLLRSPGGGAIIAVGAARLGLSVAPSGAARRGSPGDLVEPADVAGPERAANEGLSFGGARRLAASGADAYANEARSHGDAAGIAAGDGEGEPDGAGPERAVAQHDAGRSIAALSHLLDARRVIGTRESPHVAGRREPREAHRHELADPALDANRRTGRQRPDRRR